MTDIMNPRVKRAYQPSLNNYFHIRSDPFTHPIPRPLTAHEQFAPPHSVQSSLLSVGMRVRKAVPGGYQSAQQHPKLVEKPMTQLVETRANTNLPSQPAELAPFCGINKVGGYGVQQWPEANEQENEQRLALLRERSVVPISVDSVQAQRQEGGRSNKRRLEDDEETSRSTAGVFSWDPTFSPLRAHPVRPKIQPMTRRKDSQTLAVGVFSGEDAVMADVDDFEEAAFLLPPSD